MIPHRRRTIVAAVIAVALAGVPVSLATSVTVDAQASVSVAVTVDDLVTHAERVVVAQATHQDSRWEKVNGSRRIVTYTHFDVSEAIVGEAAEHIQVRTLGGVVGKVGQQVAGEAEFELGKLHLLFVRQAKTATIVVARAQGHYPLKREKKDAELVLALSPSRGKIVRRSGPRVSASDQLRKKTISAARDLIILAKKAVDDRKKQ